ncbi:hypothetical protein [Pedobacter sp. L105]|uniref:hypothetical protein n=1 Tax=Pedobacter sp. L105 TaxID=1641871 RepID=UPI00131DB2AF|nr:hypothetical protein [Pedobacter sp. L105]
MQTESNQNPGESATNKDDQPYVPFDGFVNVNDIIKKRRQLRNAEFNVSDDSWDADLNLQPNINPTEGPSEDK